MKTMDSDSLQMNFKVNLLEVLRKLLKDEFATNSDFEEMTRAEIIIIFDYLARKKIATLTAFNAENIELDIMTPKQKQRARKKFNKLEFELYDIKEEDQDQDQDKGDNMSE